MQRLTSLVLRGVLIGALSATLAATGLPAAPATAVEDTKEVTFRGVTVAVPDDWPVHRLAGRPGCVRFDRTAVYVGDPSRSTCPSTLVGRTQAVHLTTSSAQGVVDADRVVVADGSDVTAVISAGGDAAAAQAMASTVDVDDATEQVLAPRAAAQRLAPSGTRKVTAARTGRKLSVSTFTGQGFDACTARSLSELATWYSASPFKAVNMYIGGASRGCAQPNLTASWVSAVVAQGWVLIPTYVGLQAPCRTYPNVIDPAQAAAQGVAGADDAIVQLNALGLGAGNPVYFDMEAFDYANVGCRQAVLDFLGAWSARLHERGYVSGVYGSAASTIRALVSQLSNPAFVQPDDLWIARWCTPYDPATCDAGTADPEVPADKWANHQRIRQYRGGHQETWGGVTINIDSNTVDAAVSPSSLAAEGAFVGVTGQSGTYRIAGGAPLPLTSWEAVGLGPQPVQMLSPTQFAALPDRPRDGTFVVGHATGRIHRVSGGVAAHVRSWAPYGGPQPTVTVDQAALDNAGTGGIWNHLVSAPPTVRRTGPATYGSIASSARFEWAGGISSSAIATYDARWRRARWDGSFGDWNRPDRWTRTTVTDVPLGMKAGYTYCVSVRARNRAGQLSDWTTGRCLGKALDDRRLSASSGWKAKSGKRYYADTYLTTTTKGATLTRAGARLKRVGIVATTCRSCGVVNVLVDGDKVGRINLSSSSKDTRRRQVIMLPAFARQKATVTVKVRSSGERVQIDGLVISRR